MSCSVNLYLWGVGIRSRCSRKPCLIGRRESCDIVLRFSNVSAHHCQLNVNAGYWHVRDLQSRNGVKVNGVRVTDKRIDPGDMLSIAKHKYEMHYSPVELGAVGTPAGRNADAEISWQVPFGTGGAGAGKFAARKTPSDPVEPVRYDITKDEPGQIRFRHHPL